MASDIQLPLVDLHLHQERSARLNQVLAARGQQPLVDWQAWLSHLKTLPPGLPRLEGLWASSPTPVTLDLPDVLAARFELLLLEAAEAGAILAEVRVGNETLLRQELLPMFNAALSRVRVEYPGFHACLVGVLKLWHDRMEVEDALTACISRGLGGVDFLSVPYATEADWTAARLLAQRAADAGLGVTVHAGEFSKSNIAAALQLPGVRRIGHAVHAVGDPRLLDLLVSSDVAVECCLTSNVVLGAVPSLEEHPIRTLVEAGVPLVLGSDNPLQLGTDIRREYLLARSIGLADAVLLQITRTAVTRSFTSAAVKAELLARVPSGVARHVHEDDCL